jgi:signal transduction histidine kinase
VSAEDTAIFILPDRPAFQPFNRLDEAGKEQGTGIGPLMTKRRSVAAR